MKINALKRIIALLILICLLSCSSCSFENYIPENDTTISAFTENKELFEAATLEAIGFGYDCLISHTNFYTPDALGDITGLYVLNMESNLPEKISNEKISAVMESCGVKLIDVIHKNNLIVCSFDMCGTDHECNFGVYYTSAGNPVYLGDPAATLSAENNGFTYSQKAAYGSSVTFYTEPISENYFYYEIS